MQNRTSSTNSSWELTFPADLTIEDGSSVFAHRLIKVATSFILDKRGIFEKNGDNFFKNRQIDRLLVPMFDKNNAKTALLAEKINSLKEAIEEKYLREFAIVFYQKPNEEDVIEVFSFRLMYGTDGDISLSLNSSIGSQEFDRNLVQASFTDLNATKHYFCETIKKLHRSIKQLVSLPPDSDASFRASFTDNTPEDYMIKGYETSSKFYELDSETTRGQLGITCGGHHKVQLLAASQLWKSGNVDLNQTANSNVSIITKPTKKMTKGMQKKQARVQIRVPYGKTSALNKKDDNVAPV